LPDRGLEFSGFCTRVGKHLKNPAFPVLKALAPAELPDGLTHRSGAGMPDQTWRQADSGQGLGPYLALERVRAAAKGRRETKGWAPVEPALGELGWCELWGALEAGA
jgi:hypothetical protein